MSIPNEGKKTAYPETASQPHEGAPKSFDGKVVSVKGDQLVMATYDGKEHTHTLKKDAKVTCDGSTCSPTDLQVGGKIRVTVCKDDRKALTGVEALNKQAHFATTSA